MLSILVEFGFIFMFEEECYFNIEEGSFILVKGIYWVFFFYKREYEICLIGSSCIVFFNDDEVIDIEVV